MLLTKIRNFVDKTKCKNLTDEFFNEVRFRKSVNMQVTLEIISKYLVQDQLERTGILYSPHDEYIQTKAQSLFWEWKNEGIINEFEDLVETTKSWIIQYI